MKKLFIFWLTMIAAMALAIGACTTGDDDDDATITGPESVKPEPLIADATACDAPYPTSTPVAGTNLGYMVAGQKREFYLALPGNTGSPAPLLVAFNGTGGNGPDFFESAELASFVDEGFIVLAPSSNANGYIWPVWDAQRSPENIDETNPDLDYFDSLVECIASKYSVDKNRIYIGGHSAGGIMTNYVLQRRSELLAGGIAASSAVGLTGPKTPTTLGDMIVLVTWAGESDHWGGDSGANDTSVSDLDFNAEAAAVTKFYYDEPNVQMVRASIEGLGHAWLGDLNDWMIETLLSVPKGYKPAEFTLPDVPAGVDAVVSTEPHEIPFSSFDCPATDTVPECEDFCQFGADCVVSNDVISGVLAEQIKDLGYSTEVTAPDQCGGCVEMCAEKSVAQADIDVLDCFAQKQGEATCAQGIDGGMPFVAALNECCDGAADSELCLFVCETVISNSVAAAYTENCVALFE